jgi:hypothetical protein
LMSTIGELGTFLRREGEAAGSPKLMDLSDLITGKDEHDERDSHALVGGDLSQ